MNDIDELYIELCEHLIVDGQKVGNTRELTNVKMTLTDITNNVVSVRGISPAYLFAEWLWYFTGRNNVNFIGAFGSMWKNLTDDGKTNNSAYGYIMKHKFGFDQIDKVIELLQKDPDSRRAVINLNTPNERVIETKDEPCTIALQFMIRNGKLNCTCMMRSNDIWFGFPYDVAFFTELQMFIADMLGVGYGTYTHFVGSIHLYDKDYDTVKNIVLNPVSEPITFNRYKFHEYKNFLANMIQHAVDCGGVDVREMLLALARIYFDYHKEEVWQHEN